MNTKRFSRGLISLGTAAMLAVLPGVGSTAYQLTGQGPTPNWVPSGSWNGAWDGKVNSTRTVTNTLPSGTAVTIGVGGNASVASRYGNNSGFFTLDDHGGWRDNTYVDGTTYLTPAVAISNFCKTPSSNAADYDLYNQSGGWCTNNTLYTDNATLTISFSKPVTNPVINLAGVGGFDWRYRGTTGSRLAENTMRLWTEFTLTTPGATLTQLTTNPGEFEVDVTGKRYKPSGTGETVSSYCITGNNSNTSSFSSDMGGNAGCGSFRINGTGSTFSFQLDYNSVNGVTEASTPTTEFERLNNLTTDDTFIVSVSLSQDYGSAPASYDPSPTYHTVGYLFMGAGVSADALRSLTPARYATGDNETSAEFRALQAGAPTPGEAGSNYSITFPVTGSEAGKVCGWVDWNNSGTYDTGERQCEAFASGTSSKTLTWTVPATYSGDSTWLRLRASYDATGVESPVGALDSGEIEDYQVLAAPGSGIVPPTAITTQSLDFSNTSMIGALALPGSSFTYRQVATGVDARVTYVSTDLPADKVDVNWIDQVSATPDLSPSLDLKFENIKVTNNQPDNGLIGNNIKLRIDFFEAGSTKPVSLKGFSVLVRDIDVRQGAEFEGAASVVTTADAGSPLSITQTPSGIRVVDVSAQGSDFDDEPNWAEWKFDSEVSSVGATLITGNSGGNVFWLEFKSVSWSMQTTTTYLAPIAVDDSYVTAFNTPMNGKAGDRDTFAAGSVFAQTSQPANGSVVWNADGTYVYTPDDDFSGTDSFTYEITAPDGQKSAATQFITVQGLLEEPSAVELAQTGADLMLISGVAAFMLLTGATLLLLRRRIEH
jgi:hypothetical protein